MHELSICVTTLDRVQLLSRMNQEKSAAKANTTDTFSAGAAAANLASDTADTLGGEAAGATPASIAGDTLGGENEGAVASGAKTPPAKRPRSARDDAVAAEAAVTHGEDRSDDDSGLLVKRFRGDDDGDDGDGGDDGHGDMS